MERIVIEVDDDVAKKWNEVPANVKAKLEKIFQDQVDDVAQQINMIGFKELIDRIGKKAQANGLTEEILQQLLNEE